MKLTSESKFFIGILTAAVAIIGIAAVVLTRPEKPPAPLSRESLIPADSHTRGSASASAYLVEFSDFQCPACSAFAPTVEKLVNLYGDRLLFAYRHYPLPNHQYAKTAAYAAEAAGLQGKFWEAETYLFANQSQFSDEFFKSEFAKLVQLDQSQFIKDLSSDTVKKTVERDANQAQLLNLPGTPSFFLNGVLLTNLFGPQDLVKAVEDALQ